MSRQGSEGDVSGRPRVFTVVPAWNRREMTLECLASALAAEDPSVDHQVVLVDNGSTDGTAQSVAAAMPQVRLVRLPRNLGYAAGVNAGLRAALESVPPEESRDVWTLLLNNDAVVTPTLLSTLLEAAEPEDIGVVAPTVYQFDDRTTVWPSAGTRRRLTLAAIDTTAAPPSLEPYEVDWAFGCCLLVRASVWRQIGLLDERFGVYYEDQDLCLRAQAAGWRIMHVPRARAYHRVAGSTGEGSPQQMYLLARSSVPYFWRHTRALNRPAIILYRLGSLARTIARNLVRGRPSAAFAYLRGIKDGVADVAASYRPAAPGSSPATPPAIRP